MVHNLDDVLAQNTYIHMGCCCDMAFSLFHKIKINIINIVVI